MKTLHLYLASRIILSITMVIFVLFSILLFVLFVGELDGIGHGQYDVGAAFYATLLQVPYRIYQFFPMICLVGALFGLGQMVNSNELTIIRASGVSKLQVFAIATQAALLLIVIMGLVGELLAPPLLQKSYDYQAYKKSSGQVMRSAKGTWLRKNNSFIHINQIISQTRLNGIQQYEFDAEQHLEKVTTAKHALFTDGQWVLWGANVSDVSSNNVKAQHFVKMPWKNTVDQELLKVADLEPEEMTLPTLRHYIAIQKNNHTAVNQYELAYWQRLIMPLSTCVMLLLALPFVFGSVRQMSMGTRLTMGIVMGFIFFLANRFLGPFGMLFHLHPAISAITPTLLFAGGGLFVMMRTR